MADTIRKAKRRTNFTTVNNDYLQDVTLSWRAKGMITYIMSLPPDWKLNLSDLKNRSKDGRDSTAAGLRELIENGYCQRVELRADKSGKFAGCDYEVSDIRQFVPQTGKPLTDTPQTENPKPENPTLINTNPSNETDIPKKQGSKAEPANSVVGSLFEDMGDKSKTSIFRNSDIYKLRREIVDDSGAVTYDYSDFEKLFATPEFAPIDLTYYFNSVCDWSETKQGVKRTRTGWIATVRNFIRGDAEKKKLHLKPEHTAPQNKINIAGALEFLKDEY